MEYSTYQDDRARRWSTPINWLNYFATVLVPEKSLRPQQASILKNDLRSEACFSTCLIVHSLSFAPVIVSY